MNAQHCSKSVHRCNRRLVQQCSLVRVLVALSLVVLCSCRTAPNASMSPAGSSMAALSKPSHRAATRSESQVAAKQAPRQPKAPSDRAALAQVTASPSDSEIVQCTANEPVPLGKPVAHHAPIRSTGCTAGCCATRGPGPGCGPPGVPLPMHCGSCWSPPGIACPWPEDEYLCDGGDRNAPVIVEPDWTLHNLGMEDTVAHYDTIDGRTLVEPSNRVCLYAPRFGAVRTVTRMGLNDQAEPVGGVALPEKVGRANELQIVAQSLQREQLQRQKLALPPGEFGTKQMDGAVSTALLPHEFVDAYLPFENVSIIRLGLYEQTEKARLAEGVQAAIAWTDVQAVQVTLENVGAQVLAGDQRAQATYVVDVPNCPRLRLVKVASTCAAEPGDIVDFTLRFDNVGDQVIGNVVIVDNLSTRLEYVPGSSQASVGARFSTEPSQSKSLVLRWELNDPLPAGAGGVIRFRCKVR